MKKRKTIPQPPKNENVLKKHIPTILITVISTLVATILLAFSSNIKDIISLPHNFNEFIETYEKNTNDITASIDSLNIKQDRLQSVAEKINTLQGQFNEFEKQLIYNAPTVYPTENMINAINISSTNNISEKSDNEDILIIDSNDILAESSDGKTTFTASQINGKKLLMPYEDNGYEILFVGQLSNNLKWDGNCLLNKYKNNKLVFVSEATYIDGTLLNYKQAFQNSDGDGWCVSERIAKDDYYNGTSIEYASITDINKKFDLKNVSGKDIITISNFEEYYLFNSKMTKYYYGNTSNGEYNDNTGNAYYISLDDEGYVSTLYQGCFKNGKFDDKTGNAWYITRKTKDNDINMKYLYYNGLFSEGHPNPDGQETTQANLSKSDILNYISKWYYDIDLKWYGLENL